MTPEEAREALEAGEAAPPGLLRDFKQAQKAESEARAVTDATHALLVAGLAVCDEAETLLAAEAVQS